MKTNRRKNISSVALSAVVGSILVLFLVPGAYATQIQGFESGIPQSWVCEGICGTQGASTGISPTQGNYFGFIDNGGSSNYSRTVNGTPINTAFTGVSGATVGTELLSEPSGNITGGIVTMDLNFLTNDGSQIGGVYPDFAYVQILNALTGNAVATIFTATAPGFTNQAVPGASTPGLPTISPGVTLTPNSIGMNGIDTFVNGIDYGPNSQDAYGLFTGSTGWIQSSYALGAGDYQLLFVVSNSGDTNVPSALAMDNLQLNGSLSATPEPSTFWLMASGILGMFAWAGFRRIKISA